MPQLGLASEILIIFLLIVVNGLFAMSEIAVVSARKTRLRQAADRGDTRAAAALELARHPNRFLSTAQIGITLVGIFAGAYGGATVAASVGEHLARWERIEPYSDGVSLGLVVLGITFLSLVVGELVPKRIALLRPERIASAVAGPMNTLSMLAAPVVRLLGVSTDAVLALLRIRKVEDPPITEEEVTAMIRLGTEAGVFEEAEQDLVERVFRLGDQTVASLMTPREQIIWLDLKDPAPVNHRKMIRHRVQRFLVCEGGLDNLLGMVPVTELWARMLAGESEDVRDALQQPLTVPETMRALPLLELFRATDVHLALALDAVGRVQGLVTMTDILQQISGDLARATEPRIIRRDDGSWLVDGSLPMAEVWDVVAADAAAPTGEAQISETLAVFVTRHLHHTPISGEHFEVDGWRFEVMDMDGSHVDKVLIGRSGS
jgi:putative hemolysin